jgi:hypothetical protein
LQLNRHYADKDVIRKAEERVAWFKKSVGQYQEIARGGKEGVKAALGLLKDMRDVRTRLKDDLLERFSIGRAGRASVYAAEERMLKFVINLFEDPKVHMTQFERQLQEAERELSELRKLPTRD